jgi:hypothetical protein
MTDSPAARLDWLPEYDMPLGKPTGLATSAPSRKNVTGLLGTAHVWSRSFASGTTVCISANLYNCAVNILVSTLCP